MLLEIIKTGKRIKEATGADTVDFMMGTHGTDLKIVAFKGAHSTFYILTEKELELAKTPECIEYSVIHRFKGAFSK